MFELTCPRDSKRVLALCLTLSNSSKLIALGESVPAIVGKNDVSFLAITIPKNAWA